MWEQTQKLTGERQEVAATERARSYFSALGLQYGGYAAPQWEQIVTAEFWQQRMDKRNDYIFRGTMRYRLMSVDVGGNAATTEVCLDDTDVERARTGTEDWKADPAGDYRVQASTYRRSATSPTGWIAGGTADTDLYSQDCKRAFAHKPEAAVVRPGPVDLS